MSSSTNTLKRCPPLHHIKTIYMKLMINCLILFYSWFITGNGRDCKKQIILIFFAKISLKKIPSEICESVCSSSKFKSIAKRNCNPLSSLSRAPHANVLILTNLKRQLPELHNMLSICKTQQKLFCKYV